MRFASRALAAFAVLALVLFVSGQAYAGSTAVKLSRNTSSYSGGNGGGEFQVSIFTKDGSPKDVPPMGPGVHVGGYYQTFCVEWDQSFSLSTTYEWTINDHSIKGPGDTRALNPRTAWLYTQFYNGTINDYVAPVHAYDYTVGSGRTASGTAMQLALWKLQGRTSSFANAQADAFLAAANTHGWTAADGIGNVRVLNMFLTDPVTGAITNYAQDQLVMVPLPSGALAGIGLLTGVGILARIRRKRRMDVL